MMPSEYVRRNCFFGATVSGPDVKFRHDLGIDRLMWGADFPHHEGTVPYTLKALRATVAEIPEDELREIFAGTAAAVYGADMARLQEIADRVGFTPEQVAKPLGRDEIPDDPNFMMMFVAPTTVFGGKDPALAH
jgi:hypothetical protein